MQKIIFYLSFLFLISCTDPNKRMNTLKELYPHDKVYPANLLVQKLGYQFTITDSTGFVYAVKFYEGSNKKIYQITEMNFLK